MSASPDVVRRSAEELDLLLSRSLDGDLTPDEERELAAVLASDPRAARRREELAALVARLGALPAPAAPLGLTARVAARAADKAEGTGGLWRRLGIFPPPAMVRGVVALFVIVLIGINVLRSQSARQKAAEEAAKRDEGRVAIFFDGEKQSAPAPQAPAAEPESKPKTALKKGAPLPPAGPYAARKDERSEDRAGFAPTVKDAPALHGQIDAEAPAPHEKAQGGAAAVSNEGAPRQAMAVPARPAPAPAAAGVPLAWDVEIVGASARAWALRRMTAQPPSASGVTATYRLTLDAQGNVVTVRPLDGAGSESDVLVKSLVFTPLGSDPPAEIEVTVRTR